MKNTILQVSIFAFIGLLSCDYNKPKYQIGVIEVVSDSLSHKTEKLKGLLINYPDSQVNKFIPLKNLSGDLLIIYNNLSVLNKKPVNVYQQKSSSDSSHIPIFIDNSPIMYGTP